MNSKADSANEHDLYDNIAAGFIYSISLSRDIWYNEFHQNTLSDKRGTSQTTDSTSPFNDLL